MTLRVLVIGNFSVAPCGIRNFADMTFTGLSRHPNLDVTAWDATYDLIYARREAQQPTYLPDNWADYDVIHLNWHPIALNTYGAGHFPWPKGTGPLVSVYLNDVPPWSGCPVADRADCLVSPEDYPGTEEQRAPDHLMVYPIPDWVDHLPKPDPEFTVGWSGVRGDGHALLAGVCETHGWKTNCRQPGDPWTTTDEEIRRLARSTVNVCWYHQQRGIAGTPSVMLGTRRPLLLNDSQMFRPWLNRRYPGIYLGLPPETTLDAHLRYLHYLWQEQRLERPHHDVYAFHGWTVAAQQLIWAWHKAWGIRQLDYWTKRSL